MKEFQVIKKQYSVFGDFSKYLNNIDKIEELFPAFTRNDQKEQLRTQDGKMLESPVYIFSNTNLQIKIARIRLDFIYFYNNEPLTDEEFMDFVEDFSSKFTGEFAANGVRISYLENEFLENQYGVNSNSQAKELNLVDLFGTRPDETSMRLNFVQEIALKERINTIVAFQDGAVTNNNTKETKKVISFNYDVNTLVQNNTPRFAVDDSLYFLKELIKAQNELRTKVANLYL